MYIYIIWLLGISIELYKNIAPMSLQTIGAYLRLYNKKKIIP